MCVYNYICMQRYSMHYDHVVHSERMVLLLLELLKSAASTSLKSLNADPTSIPHLLGANLHGRYTGRWLE